MEWEIGISHAGFLGFLDPKNEEAGMLIRVQRRRKTKDGIFGTLNIDDNPFGCFTVESLEHAIPAGYYTVEFTYSPEFNMVLPLIDVPNRTAIRIHAANRPDQLLGCIAVGDTEEVDAVDNSRITLNLLNKIITGQTDLHIMVTDIPEGNVA